MKLQEVLYAIVALVGVNALHLNTISIDDDSKRKQPPVIVFGGMGSNCSDGPLPNLIEMLKEGLNKTHVECYESKVFGSMRAQSHAACDYLKSNTHYNQEKEINVVGISQGGLLGRYIIEDCQIEGKDSDGKHISQVRNFLSIGSPQMGFTEIPEGGCNSSIIHNDDVLCNLEKKLLSGAAYEPLIQNAVAPAGYYRDSENITNYKQKSSYLAKLNNEASPDSELAVKQKEKMMQLKNLMLVEFDQDEIVYPRNSEIFGEVSKRDKDGKREKVDMEDTEIYKNDWLGLKYLQEHNKIKMVHIDAQHIKYTPEDVHKTFLPFLRL